MFVGMLTTAVSYYYTVVAGCNTTRNLFEHIIVLDCNYSLALAIIILGSYKPG